MKMTCLLAGLTALFAQAQLPPPDIAEARYGPHPRNVLDLWKANSPGPAPLVVFIHGGGFVAGSKANLSPLLLELLLKQGISVAAINYRYATTASFPAPMLDGARAVQFLRSKATQWNLDPRAVGATGGSAGACMSLWLGYHDDLADLAASDPVARQSSKFQAMAVQGAQTSVDPRLIARLISPITARHPSGKYFYGIPEAEWNTPKADAIFKEASPIWHLSAGDPPAFLYYSDSHDPVPPDAKPGAGIHHPKFGELAKQKCDQVGTECVVKHRDDYGAEAGRKVTEDMVAFLAKHLQRQQLSRTPPPDYANVTYGPHGRNVMDVWLARSEKPAPVVFFIHGGGFVGGDKSGMDPELLRMYLDQGWNAASINYRYSTQAAYPAPMRDGARAVQFLRAHAAAFHADPHRIASTGGSAGAGISLWIGFHDDMADAASADPVRRQSTRLSAMAVLGAQSAYSPLIIRDLIGETTARHPALPMLYGIPEAELFSPRHARLFADSSAVTHLGKGDPPVYAFYNEPRGEVPAGAKPGTGIHHIKFGFYLKERMDKLGIECIVRHGDELGPQPMNKLHQEMVAFLGKHLKQD